MVALAASSLPALATIPPPFLYLDFEAGAGGEEFLDKSGNGQTVVVDGAVAPTAGAPGGFSPTGGAELTGGHLDITSIDAASQLANRTTNDQGSYSFACWLKPEASANGDGFIWGQTNQGIHSGIRNHSGRPGALHTAHWGADFQANTIRLVSNNCPSKISE